MNNIYYGSRMIINKSLRFIIPIALLSIIIFIPYPETITGEATLVHIESHEVCVIGQLPYKYIKKIEVGTLVRVELEGYRVKKDGRQCGYITHINVERLETYEGNFFSYYISLNINPFMYKGMKGKVSIKLPSRNLLTRAIGLSDNK